MAVSAGATLALGGRGKNSVTGSITDNGMIEAKNYLITVDGPFSGSGELQFANLSTLERERQYPDKRHRWSKARDPVRNFALCAFSVALVFISGSCTNPDDKQGAIGQVIGEGFILPGQRSGNQPGTPKSDVFVGPGLLTRTEVVSGKNACDGAIGSVIPPLSITQCAGSVLTLPLLGVEKLLTALSGGAGVYGEYHIYLTGIEQYWVQQNEQNDCWAAALETTRRYLNLYPVSQSELIGSARRVCPMLSTKGRAADAYEIAFSIASTLQIYDRPRTNPTICPDIECIVGSLRNRHPVIMLGAGHAVVIVGMDYAVRGTGPKPLIVVERVFVLDPASKSAEVQTWSPFGFCKADVFIAY